jgi:hypothetical protein
VTLPFLLVGIAVLLLVTYAPALTTGMLAWVKQPAAVETVPPTADAP